ncbi:methylated-DNA--[protein]-cysteine S-methyltransferase [Nostocoides sp. HKS02]|uniref:methylated-DNA--[protein]-cysteine S-methyltransferase n=1 Tax=Nostocoides sp. HKS02 TaxID=1813880 RepID=UPI001E3FCA5E|nr:methylated-DNA--[protein]-cysteine S-methyltransferase [Tetrasphaera sp. HKS02]
MRTHTVMASPVGDLTLVAEDGALVRLTMDRQKHAPDASDPAELGERDDDGFGVARTQLGEYFAGTRTTFDLPLAPHGDPFKQQVWALLREIPYGETRTYGELARALGDVNLSQAVGSANGRNPIGIIVPCHRVIGSDGSLVGYAGGLDRKRFLLALEEPQAVRDARLF